MRIKWGVIVFALALLAVASVSAHHDHQDYRHSNNYYADHYDNNRWYDDTRHVTIYRHHYTNYYVPAPRGYPHTRHRHTHTTYRTYHPSRSYDHCYRRNTRWRCR